MQSRFPCLSNTYVNQQRTLSTYPLYVITSCSNFGIHEDLDFYKSDLTSFGTRFTCSTISIQHQHSLPRPQILHIPGQLHLHPPGITMDVLRFQHTVTRTVSPLMAWGVQYVRVQKVRRILFPETPQQLIYLP